MRSAQPPFIPTGYIQSANIADNAITTPKLLNKNYQLVANIKPIANVAVIDFTSLNFNATDGYIIEGGLNLAPNTLAGIFPSSLGDFTLAEMTDTNYDTQIFEANGLTTTQLRQNTNRISSNGNHLFTISVELRNDGVFCWDVDFNYGVANTPIKGEYCGFSRLTFANITALRIATINQAGNNILVGTDINVYRIK